jgi:uncharacterized membrane protein
MAERKHIQNPAEWALLLLYRLGAGTRSLVQSIVGTDSANPEIARISLGDLGDALKKGWEDTLAFRTDVFFLCLVYPIMGLVLVRVAFEYEMLPLVFPIIAGFALIGPAAAVSLYEMSRRREKALPTTWADGFGVLGSHAFGAIFFLGLILASIFLLWLMTADTIYRMTLGPNPPVSIEKFLSDVLTTEAGWIMAATGIGVGLLFAVFVLSISVISFPLLLDREVGVAKAIWTSVRSITMNPLPMMAWGLIVASGLVLGSLPLLLGLVLVMPILGHATWHLYRKVVRRKSLRSGSHQLDVREA